MKFPWQKDDGKQDQLNRSISFPKAQPTPPSKGRIIAVANQKGGVGKTTTVTQAGNSLPGKKLLVDIDPQGSASFATGTYMLGNDQPTMVDLLANPNIDIRRCIVVPQRWDGIHVLPCDIRLTVLEQDIAQGERVVPLNLLKMKLSEIAEEYDYIIIDTPPSLGTWTINALRAAHRVLVPIESSDPYSVLGFNQLIQSIHKQQIHNPQLRILGCFRTMVLSDKDGQERTKIGNQLWNSIKERYPDLIMKATVPINIRVKEVTLDNEHLSARYEESSVAKAHLNLANEIVSRWEDVVRTW